MLKGSRIKFALKGQNNILHLLHSTISTITTTSIISCCVGFGQLNLKFSPVKRVAHFHHHHNLMMGDINSYTLSSPAKCRGTLILFEGLDRSGKSTQAELLTQYLREKTAAAKSSKENCSFNDVQLMRFPDRSSVIGKLIDSYLKMESNLDDHAIHLLFAANRWECKSRILSLLSNGCHVVMDRYSYSGAAYSNAKGIPLDFAMSSEIGLPEPDIVYFINISIEEAEKRGGYGQERYEKKEFQRRVKESFESIRLMKQQNNTQGQRQREWQLIEGGEGKSIESIHKEIVGSVEETIETVKYLPIKQI